MRNKASLILMEQLAMVLIFALAAAICLRMFVLSDRISENQEAKAQAAVLAQNTAEQLKSRGENGSWIQTYDKNWNLTEEPDEIEYTLTVQEEPTGISGLIRVTITVMDGGETLFAIPAAWQEVTGHE